MMYVMGPSIPGVSTRLYGYWWGSADVSYLVGLDN